MKILFYLKTSFYNGQKYRISVMPTVTQDYSFIIGELLMYG